MQRKDNKEITRKRADDSFESIDREIMTIRSQLSNDNRNGNDRDRNIHRSRDIKRNIATAIVATMLLLFVMTTLMSEPQITGWVIKHGDRSTIRQELGWNLTASAEKELVLEQATGSTDVKMLMLSGKVTGEGNAKAYLLDGSGNRYLILDQDSTETPVRLMLPEFLTTDAIPYGNNTDGRTIETGIGYASDSPWDTDDNGIAYEEDGVVDLTVEETVFSWQAEESMLCTKWTVTSYETGTAIVLCNGAPDCCAVVGVRPESDSWKEPLYIFQGKYNTTENNRVTAQAIFINQSIGENTYMESVVGTQAALPLKFIKKPVMEFKDICMETCMMPPRSDDATYTISFELTPGVELFIEEVKYAVENETETGDDTILNNTTGTSVELTPEIKDSKGNRLKANVEFVDKYGTIKASKDMEKKLHSKKGARISSAEDNNVNLTSGKYHVKIDLSGSDSPVKRIDINDLNIDENSTEFIRVDDVNETGEFSTFLEVYAIDPTGINFTSANVTVTATGSMLYKCAEWEFDTQSCTGSWTPLMAITPGQEYTFTLTPEDPGYGEATKIEAETLTLAGGYVSSTNCACASPSGTCIRHEGSVGLQANATYSSNMTSATYNITMRYCPEDDGDDMYAVYVNNVQVGSFAETSDTQVWENQTFTGISLGPTDTLKLGCIRGSVNTWCRVDYLTLTQTSNSPPTQSTPVLNSTIGSNTTNENITCYNTSTNDPEANPVKSIFNWYRNSTNIIELNMPFEGGSNSTYTKDYSGNGNDGTVSGANWSGSYGIDGKGTYDFDGTNDYLSAGTGISPTTAVSICAWIYPHSWGTGSDQDIILRSGYLNNESNFALEFNNDRRDASTHRDLVFMSGGNFTLTYSGIGSVIDLNEWNHICATFDNDNSAIYVNGNIVASGVNGKDLTTASQEMNIGGRSGSSDCFDGKIDDLTIWNIELTQQQVQARYQNRTNTIVEDQTNTGDVWKCAATPNDGTVDGSTTESNTLTIVASGANTAPTQGTPTLNSTTGANTTSENLTCYNQSTYDANGDSVKSIFNWYRNSTSIAVLNMPFEGGSNSTYTKDYSGNANHGTVSGATWNRTGGYDGRAAYKFNGSTYVDTGASTTLLVGTRFTQEAWIYPTITDTNYHGFLGYEPGVTVQRAPSIWIYNLTSIHAGFGNGSVWDGFITGAIITQNAWNHVVVTFDGTNYTVYVNGASRYSTTSHAGRIPYATPIRDIGRVDNYFNGTIDEVRIYNRSLSAQEITYLYQTGTNRMVSNELIAGDIWKCSITPNDGTTDGSTTDSNTITIRSIPDTTPPSTVSGLTERATGTTWIYWNWTNPTDSDFSQAIIYLNGTNVANTSNNSYNATSLGTYRTYQITVKTKDTSGNINTTNVSDTAITQDGISPQYSNIRDQNNTAYSPGGSYQFNITWTDNIAVNDITFQLNGINYTNPSQNGAEYYITMSDLAAGTYTYRWYANDFLSNTNQTGDITFVISKAAPTLNLAATPGWNETYGTETIVNCTTDNSVTPQLYRDDEIVALPDIQNLGVSDYEYTCNSTATANYTYGTATNTLSMTKAASAVSILLNGTDGNRTIERLSSANITATRDTGDSVAIYLYMNGTLVSSGNSPLTNFSQYTVQADYNMTAEYQTSQNYSASSDTHWLLVRDTTPPSTATSLIERSVGTSWIEWNWTNPTDADFSLAIIYLNGTNVANTSENQYNATGLDSFTIYHLTIQTEDIYGNININNISDDATTLDNTPPSYGNIEDNNGTTYAPSKQYMFNVTWTDNVAVNTVTFAFDGTNHSSNSAGDEYYTTLTDVAAGTHQYRWYATDAAGNTNSTDDITLIIEKAATTLNITSIPGNNVTYGTQTIFGCTADNSESAEILYRNGSMVSIPDTQTLAAANYEYVCNASATQNYSSSQSNSILTVNKAPSSVNLLLNGTDGDRTIEVGTSVNETGSIVAGENILEIYENGTLAASGYAPLTKTTQYNNLGAFNVTVLHAESTNYTSSSETHTITVSDTTAPIILLESPEDSTYSASQTQTFMFNFTDNYHSNANCTLYLNGTASGTNSSAAGTTTAITYGPIPEGYNEWYVNCTDPSENSGVSETRTRIIDITPPTITPVRPKEGETIGYITTMGVDITDNLAGVHDPGRFTLKNSSGITILSYPIYSPYRQIVNTSLLPDGNYTSTYHSNDTLNNSGDITVHFTISNTEPDIQIMSPNNASRWNSAVNISITYQDNELSYIGYNITNSSGNLIRSNSSSAVNLTSFNLDELLDISSVPDGDYLLTAYANDTTGYSVTERTTFIIDKTPPTYSAVNEPQDPSTYAMTGNYNFNTTWTDLNGIGTVKLQMDGTNYTCITQAGSTHYKIFSTLASGVHSYRWYANDTAGNTNSTDSLNFTVNKASSSCVLWFDKSSPQTYGTQMKANCSCTNPESSAILWRNNTDVTPEENNAFVTLAAGNWQYSCNTTETQNYTSADDDATFTIEKMVPNITLDSITGWNNTYGTQTTVSCSATNTTATPGLYRDGIPVTNPETMTLASQIYNHTCSVAETQNYTSMSETRILYVNKAQSSVSLTINGSAANTTIERMAESYIFASRTAGEGQIQLYRNGTLLGTGNSVEDLTTYNTENSYNITAIHPETQNYTESRMTLSLNIDDTTPAGYVTNLLLLNKGLNYLYWVWTAPTDADFSHTQVYLNGTFKTNTLNEYYYATSLNHSATYQISLRSVDTYGTLGNWVNDTQVTMYNCTENWVPAHYPCQLYDTRIKHYNDTMNCGTTAFRPADEGMTESCDCVVSTSFYGTTTNFTGIMNNMSDVVLDVPTRGIIRFQELITVSRCMDLDAYAAIGEKHAYIGSVELPEFNKSANITLYDINFTSPRIMVDGIPCPADTCSILNYSEGIIIFNVTHFTNYSVEESPYCGDASCNDAETCGSCALDCGQCASGGGGGGGGGGSSPKKKEECVPNWLCYSWGTCDSNYQSRACFDTNGCNNESDKPLLQRACVSGCTERWACGDWSFCTEAGIQTRECNDLAKCKTESRKPQTVQPCDNGHCYNGRQDSGEEGIDCGGKCRACTEEDKQKTKDRNLLTGEAITLQPYEPTNPIYLMPLLLLLVLLIAIIALHKANVSERMKKILTISHVMLVILIFVMLLLTFDIPQTTGKAVSDMLEGAEASSFALTIIISAFLIGGFTYVALNNGLPDLDAIESYYMKSKYWTGYAMQKIKWSPAKNRKREEMEVHLPALEKSAAEKIVTAPDSRISEMINALKRSEAESIAKQKQAKEAKEKEQATDNIKEDVTKEEKTTDEDDMIADAEDENITEPEAETKNKIETAKIPEIKEKTKPVKVIEKKKEEHLTPQSRLIKKFGTEDPLKIAERIMKNQQGYSQLNKRRIRR